MSHPKSSDARIEISQEISRRVRAVRLRRGLTVKRVGEKVGLKASSYQAYDVGRISSWPVELLILTAEALKVPMASLLPNGGNLDELPASTNIEDYRRQIQLKIGDILMEDLPISGINVAQRIGRHVDEVFRGQASS